MEAINADYEEQAEKIYHDADQSPFPDPIDVYNHVYSNMEPEVGH